MLAIGPSRVSYDYDGLLKVSYSSLLVITGWGEHNKKIYPEQGHIPKWVTPI